MLLVASMATQAARAPTPHVPATLLLRVVDSATQMPVPNAEITAHERRGVTEVQRRGLTDARGEVRVLYPEDGELRVHVRQIGFRYAERTFRRNADSRAEEDTAVVALGRLGFALPQVVVRAERNCKEPVDPSSAALTAASMELLRFGAQQFDNFRRTYPFDFTLEQRTTGASSAMVRPRPRVQVDTLASMAWGDRYVPGKVVTPRGRDEYFVPLLFVSALADSTFWELHCFVARGVESRDGRRLIRLDFTPTLDVRDPDWEGSAWLDSARSVLARVDFRLTNLHSMIGPQRFGGYTVFSTPTPYIARPDSTVASWITGTPSGAFGEVRRSGGTQMLLIREVMYRGRKPPEIER
jgi:hypothetical protein